MSERYAPFDADTLSAEARAVHDEILARRGYIPGPYHFWLAAPGYAERMEKVEDFLRHGVILDARLVELLVLLSARHWRCSYVWTSHVGTALRVGLDPAAVEAIRCNERPELAREDEAVCHDLCQALLAARDVNDTLWAQARTLLGERGINELLGLLGLYTSACLTMLAYRVPTKNGESDPFGD